MSLDNLDILNQELPELFQPRDLAPCWDDELIIVSVDNPESIGDSQIDDSILTSTELEQFAANQLDLGSFSPDLSPSIVMVLSGAHSGAPVPYSDHSKMPPPDCLAFYLPFHYYHPTWWGVYLQFEGVLWLAGEIVRRSGRTVSKHQAIQAARLFLYYHEAFHHKTECFATRLELTHRKPFYKTGFERLYLSTVGTRDCLEEGLANAAALTDISKKMGLPTVKGALEGYVLDSPPGYDQGVRIQTEFQATRCVFAEENQRGCLPHLPAKDPNIWRTTPHMFDGIANIKSRVNYVISRSSPLGSRLPFRPMLPPGKFVKKLKELTGLEFVRNGGNHDIYRARSGKTVPIPRHPRDLGRGLVRKILREAGLDMGLEEFLQQ